MRIPAALIAVSLALGATAAHAGDAATTVEKSYEEQQREALKAQQKADVKAGKAMQEQQHENLKDQQDAQDVVLDPVTDAGALNDAQENQRENLKDHQKAVSKAVKEQNENDREALKDAQKMN